MWELNRHLRGMSDYLDSLAPNKITSVTWLNHHSLATVMRTNCHLDRFSLIGIDGFFLHYISGSKVPRSSADLFLPLYLNNRPANIGVIGGPVQGLSERDAAFSKRFPQATCKFFIDGFSSVQSRDLISEINRQKVSVLLVGMGTPFQENLVVDVLENSENLNEGLIIFTCGAWLEQLLHENFYPKWAYKYKLNWLVRLAREPKRLWKRYFIESFRVLFTKSKKLNYLESLSGYQLIQNLPISENPSPPSIKEIEVQD